MGLGYVESIQNEYGMVVFGQSHDVPLRGDLESAAAGDLDVRALELWDERPLAVEHGHVELVAVRVPNEHVALVADVDAVGKAGDGLGADPAQEVTVLGEDDDRVALEVADVVLGPVDGDVGGLRHVVRAFDVVFELPELGHDEDGGGHGVYGDDEALAVDGQAGDDVDVADLDEAHEVAGGGEDLHARALAAAVADDVVAAEARREDRNLARIPQAALFFASQSETAAEAAIFVEYLGEKKSTW